MCRRSRGFVSSPIRLQWKRTHLHLRGEHAWFAAAAVREILPSNPMVIPFPRNTTPAGPDMDGDHPEDLRRTGTRKS